MHYSIETNDPQHPEKDGQSTHYGLEFNIHGGRWSKRALDATIGLHI